MNTTFALSLPQLALIAVSGADADAFLQGQLSNDVRRVAPDRAQLTSYNSPKGRVLAILHLLRAPEGLLLELPRELLEPVLKRLRLHVLRSKVVLAASDRATFGVAGPDAPAVLAQLQLAVPTSPLECAWTAGVAVVHRIGHPLRYTVHAPAAQAATVAEQLAKLAPARTWDDWRGLDIEAGVPTVTAATQDRFVAQMINLDALGGISFDKGCYTGQEVVARVHYRGAVKRHLEALRLSGPPPAAGTTLELPDGRRGEVVEAVAMDGGCLVQAVLSPAGENPAPAPT